MANQWFRMWHGAPNDPKFRTIARVSGQPISLTLAVFMHILDDASQNVTRGHVNVTIEDLASALDVTEEQIDSILKAMQDRVLDGSYVSGWEARQPKREDVGNPETGAKSAAERKRAQRKREKLAKTEDPDSDCHDESREVTIDKDKDKDKDKDIFINTDPSEKTPKKVKKKSAKTTIPEDFSISNQVLDWYQENNYQEDISQHLENFKDQCAAKGYTYADFDAAFKNAIRNDWAGLRKQKSQSMTGQGNNSGSNKSRQNYDRKHRINRDDILSTDF